MKKHLIFLLFINFAVFGFSQGSSTNNEIAPQNLSIVAIRNLLDEEDYFYKSALVDNSIILKLGNNMVTYDLTIRLVEDFLLLFTSSIETSESISAQRLERLVSNWNEENQLFPIYINYTKDNTGELKTLIENLYFYTCIGGINSDNLNSTLIIINSLFEDLISYLKDEDAI